MGIEGQAGAPASRTRLRALVAALSASLGAGYLLMGGPAQTEDLAVGRALPQAEETARETPELAEVAGAEDPEIIVREAPEESRLPVEPTLPEVIQAPRKVISGRVVDDRGAPVPEFLVGWSTDPSPPPRGSGNIILPPFACDSRDPRPTDVARLQFAHRIQSPDGSFQLRIPPRMRGSLVACAVDDDLRRSQLIRTFDVDKEVHLTLKRWATIEGRVSNAPGSPAAAVRVVLRGRGSPQNNEYGTDSYGLYAPYWEEVTATDEGGRFTFSRLWAGEYQVQAHTADAYTQTLSLELRPGDRNAEFQQQLLPCGALRFEDDLATARGWSFGSKLGLRSLGSQESPNDLCLDDVPSSQAWPLAEGSYRLTLHARRGEQRSRTFHTQFEIQRGVVHSFDPMGILLSGRRLRGRVARGLADEPVPEWAKLWISGTSLGGTPVAEGQFELPTLKKGQALLSLTYRQRDEQEQQSRPYCVANRIVDLASDEIHELSVGSGRLKIQLRPSSTAPGPFHVVESWLTREGFPSSQLACETSQLADNLWTLLWISPGRYRVHLRAMCTSTNRAATLSSAVIEIESDEVLGHTFQWPE